MYTHSDPAEKWAVPPRKGLNTLQFQKTHVDAPRIVNMEIQDKWDKYTVGKLQLSGV